MSLLSQSLALVLATKSEQSRDRTW